MANRLAEETSPYLLQHKDNPVDWQPWGPEALERAAREDKPILLSIGYSACHWCHVMERESFEDEETAALMNASFVPIKVDREERPDVDDIYMEAVQGMTGQGGWPLTVFLDPEGVPFYGGTYFPPEPRQGMPSFRQVLEATAGAYRNQREELREASARIRESLGAVGKVEQSGEPLDQSILAQAISGLEANFDRSNGGFGGAPKFPPASTLEFLLDRGQNEPVRLTLDKMMYGGIYDQLGGGFARYSVDATWLVPHFEKMLYDNALLASVYLHAWQLTGEASYRRVCEETLDYVLREMTDSSGGFYSTQDADSEGVEGKFYVWMPADIREALGEADAAIVEKLWGVTESGNFEGHNILHCAKTPAEVATEMGLEEEQVREATSRARSQLYEARRQRVAPARDDKVLTAWNGLMQRAFAEAGRILDRQDYRDAAVANAQFLLGAMRTDSGLLRSWRNGNARIPAYLEDYAALANAVLSSYESTGNLRFFSEARALADEALTRFWDDEIETFFDTASDHERLIGRPRELTDNATPSGMSLMAEALLRLAAFTGEHRHREHAERVLAPLIPDMLKQPLAFGHLLCALDDFVGPMDEVAIVGDPDAEGTRTLLNIARHVYRPRMVLAQAALD
ncbi:MAG TPA: thioredoxin domain-containing protein, partial [Solirubrobacterales bacterium]|nr:thioredoxin domain-containing protein [Solirubrobacterales bacterium]